MISKHCCLLNVHDKDMYILKDENIVAVIGYKE